MNWDPQMMQHHTPWPICLLMWAVELPLIAYCMIFYAVTTDSFVGMAESMVGYDQRNHSWPKCFAVAGIALVAQTLIFAASIFVIGNMVMDILTPAWFQKRHWWNKEL